MITLSDLRARGSDGNPIIDLADVCDLNEILLVNAENQKRAQDYADREAKRKI